MLKFLEGFDSYGPTNFASQYKWSNSNTVALNTGRFGGFAAYLDTTVLTKTIDPCSGMTVGFSIILPENGGDFMTFLDDTSATALTIGTSSISSLLYFDGVTTVYSGVPLPRNTWVYFEVSIYDFAATAAGNIVVRLNGETIFESPLGFTLLGSGIGGGITLLGGTANEIGYDDVYICDNTGDYNTGFIEDGEILTLLPNGAGDETQLSLFGAATNWEAVSEVPFDGDTSYVFGNVAGTQDLYTIDTMATGVTFVIPGIMVNTVARKDGPDTVGVRGLVKSSGNVGTGTGIDVTTSYLTYQQVFEKEPVTNADWNETLINTLQMGVEVYI